MVVSNKSAFQLKLKYFEDISHENYKYNSANSSRRNTIELETSAFEDTKYEHVEKNNVTCNPGSEYNNSVKSLEGSKIVEPEISLSLRKTINDVRKQFLQFSSTDIDSSAEQRINTHNKKEKLNKGNRNSASLVESARKESFIKRTINDTRRSYEESNKKLKSNKELSPSIVHTRNFINGLDHSLSSNRNFKQKHFNVILKGSFYQNPFSSLLQFTENTPYSSEDEEFYCFDFFDY